MENKDLIFFYESPCTLNRDFFPFFLQNDANCVLKGHCLYYYDYKYSHRVTITFLS